MKKYRKLVLSYSKDTIKKKDQFIQNYKLYKKELDNKDIKFCVKKSVKRSQLFNISLYGYDGKLKFVTNKINSIPTIIKQINKMPLEKMKQKIKSIELYTNSHPNTTIKGTGFKNENTAKKSIKLLKGKSDYYKFLVINTLYQRAKYHPHQTKNMKNAMKIFQNWIKKYKLKQKLKNKNKKNSKTKKIKGGSSNNSKISFPYLSLNIINKFEKLAEYYNISRKARGLEKPTTSDEGFLVVFRRVNGNGNKLKNIPCRKNKPDGVNWERKRVVEVSGKLGQSKRMKLPLFHGSGPLKGLPTKIHINMIMWAYSPEPIKLKNSIKILNAFCKTI